MRLLFKSAQLLHAHLLSTCCGEAGQGNELHGRLFQGVPAVVPCDPNDAVVEAIFTRVLFCVPATWAEGTKKSQFRSDLT